MRVFGTDLKPLLARGEAIVAPQRHSDEHTPSRNIFKRIESNWVAWQMRLSVVIVNWRDTTQTIRCAQTLRRWSTLTPQILVVDNESTESSRTALVHADIADRLICSPINRGYGGGNNLGIRATILDSNSIILLLNPDAAITEAATHRLLLRLETDPSLSIVGPAIRERLNGTSRYYVGGCDIARFVSTRIEADLSSRKALRGYPLVEVDYVPGAVFMARSTVYQNVGMLDEQYFFSGEIADFCKRAHDMGHKICVDLEVEAFHDAQLTPNRYRESLYIYYNLRNRFLYIRKHYPHNKAEYFAYWAKIAFKEAVAAIGRRRWNTARAILLALLHGLINRYGDQNGKFL
jgi:GT2 family glycosyltransferase